MLHVFYNCYIFVPLLSEVTYKMALQSSAIAIKEFHNVTDICNEIM